jgi:nicotinamidase/pyrazinamidase
MKYPICIDRTASFDVDAQKGFTPICPAELPVPDGDKIVEALNRQAKFAKYRVGSKDAHPLNAVWEASAANPQFSPIPNEPNADIHWTRHCVSGTKGGELLDGLPAVTDYDFFVWKGMEPNIHPYGACFHDLAGKMSTGVIEWLHAKKINTVLVGGLATDYCVITTALQLRTAGFNVIMNLSACRGIASATVEKACAKAKDAGILIIPDCADLVQVSNHRDFDLN